MKIYLVYVLLLANLCASEIRTGAENLSAYLPLLKGKRVGVVVNHASTVGESHLVDLLLSEGVRVRTIFAPEHGFRGQADAGEHVKDGLDSRSGLPIVSLYGKHKKPAAADLEKIDLILFDIQDVGVRFYTYLSTLHYVMEAAAENKMAVVVLDRPNPNGDRIDGPVLQKAFRSFVGLHPVPILYAMTIGEYAGMINGEGWLKGALKADLTVIPLKNYRHSDFYHLPVKPSPNLPNDLSIALYPSLALFEGTVISAGRGTTRQFQLYGAPGYTQKGFSFIPLPREGAGHPKHKDKRCYGVDLSGLSPEEAKNGGEMDLAYLLDAYRHYDDKKNFFLQNNFFDRLAGTDRLRKQIIAGKSERDIRMSWQAGLAKFKGVRERYLLYP